MNITMIFKSDGMLKIPVPGPGWMFILSPAYPLIVLFVKLKLSVRNSLNVKLLPLFKLIEDQH